MVDIVTLPKLGISDEGELVAWEKDVGEYVEEEEEIAVLESDKAAASITATASGTLLKKYLEEGEVIAIEPGRPIAAIGAEGETAPEYDDIVGADGTFDATAVESTETETSTEDTSETEAASESPQAEERREPAQSSEAKLTPKARRVARERDIDISDIEGSGPQGAVTASDIEAHDEQPADTSRRTEQPQRDPSAAPAPPTDKKVSPRARRAAGEFGVSLDDIEGTGPEGSVVESDVEAYVAQLREQTTQEPSPASEPVSTGSPGLETTGTTPDTLTVNERRTLSGTRRTVAERLSQSAREKPHVMGTREISIEQLLQVQERLEDELDEDISLNDLILGAVAETLQDFPEFNAHFVDGEHRLIDEVNIGYAVDSPKGLIVPVVKDADDLSVPELARERRDLVKRTLEDEQRPADLQGGTFTVTNVGVFDLDVSYSIINPPQVAILAVGRRKPTPVERDGEVQFEPAITFSLTIDHRVLDGADTGRFLQRLADYIEYPGFALTTHDQA